MRTDLSFLEITLIRTNLSGREGGGEMSVMTTNLSFVEISGMRTNLPGRKGEGERCQL